MLILICPADESSGLKRIGAEVEWESSRPKGALHEVHVGVSVCSNDPPPDPCNRLRK